MVIRILEGHRVRRALGVVFKNRTLRMRIDRLRSIIRAQVECLWNLAAERAARREVYQGHCDRITQLEADNAQLMATLIEAQETCRATAQEKSETKAVLAESLRTTSQANRVKNDIKVTLARSLIEEQVAVISELRAEAQTWVQKTETVQAKLNEDRATLPQLRAARQETSAKIVEAELVAEKHQNLTTRLDTITKDRDQVRDVALPAQVQEGQRREQETKEHARQLDFAQLESHFAIVTREDKIRKENNASEAATIEHEDKQWPLEVQCKAMCERDEKEEAEYIAHQKRLQERKERLEREYEQAKATSAKEESQLDDRMAQCGAVRRKEDAVQTHVATLKAHSVKSEDAYKVRRRRVLEKEAAQEVERLQVLEAKRLLATTRADKKACA
ncbi:hypothetical protein K474DRAFT_764856 [Panus rudis PR-1116 ss-1]|nr:hypothetical protein K474DRAFT_764856 [Panus rudis PR-1116 ss-1]